MSYKLALLVPLIALALLSLPSVHADTMTITLTGSCNASLINSSNNSFTFNIGNSGNGSATNMALIPLLNGASTRNTSVTIPTVSPNATYSVRFYLDNFTLPGSYAEYIYASYYQGSTSFTTLFPCELSIGKRVSSDIVVLSMNYSHGALDLVLFNAGHMRTDANVSIKAPLSFSVTPSHKNVILDPQSPSSVEFNITHPNYTGASFPLAASASYVYNGTHYASSAITVVSFPAKSTKTLTGDFIAVGIAIVILVLVSLIIFSVIHKRAPPRVNGEKAKKHEAT